jgi:sugar transferase (PEP-CTERM/EpsH1 system associated)
VTVLFLTHRLPYAPNRGDRIRTFYILRTLAKRWPVHVVSLVHDAEEATHAPAVSAVAASVTTVPVPWLRNRIAAVKTLLTSRERPLTLDLLDAPSLPSTLDVLIERIRPDVLLTSSSSTANFALRDRAAALPLVLDLIDVDSEKWAALANAGGWLAPVYRREARALHDFEAQAIAHAFATCVVNERERAALSYAAPDQVHVVPLGVDVGELQPRTPAVDEPSVVFSGVMSYGPNVDAALWLLDEIWPLVLRSRPDATLTIVGSNPTRPLRLRAARSANTMVTGAVEDARPYLWRAAVAAAPLRFARGLQTKVIQSVAAGLPTVITPVVAEGLPEAVMPACRTAATPKEFATAIVDLLALTPEQRRSLAARADCTALDSERLLTPLVELIQRAAQSRAAVSQRDQ